MRSIFNAEDRQRLRRRLEMLTPATPARWGRMDAPRMICHLIDSLASSEAAAPPPGTGVLAHFPVKQLVLYWLPWPKAKLQSPPDLLATCPGEWAADMERLQQWLERVAARDPQEAWPDSEVFGRMSGHEWGALLWTHLNHHLKQFGV